MKQIILLLLLFSSITAFSQKTNFSGLWSLDTAKTSLDNAPIWVIPKTIKAEQQVDKLILTRVSLDQQFKEQAPIVETLGFDRTPFQRAWSAGPMIATSMHW